MRVYTVHLLNIKSDDGLEFVREGFSVWAFLLSWLWALRHRLWLFAGVILVANMAVAGLELHPAGQAALSLGISVAAGLFGNDMRRRALAGRGYRDMGVVAEGDEDSAARRFLDAHPVLTESMVRA